MRNLLFILPAIFLSSQGVADQFEDAVCNAMPTAIEKARCRKEMNADEWRSEREREIYEASEKRRQEETAAKAANSQRSAFDENTYGPECGADFDCWASTIDPPDYNVSGKMCDKAIENSAKYQARWLGDKHYPNYYNPAKMGKHYHSFVVGFGGSEVLYQNGFSAWRRVNYICWYDTLLRKPIAVDVVER